MNKTFMKKRKAKFSLNEYEYVGKEKGKFFTIRCISNKVVNTIEIKEGSKIHCSLHIVKDNADRLDVYIRSNCNSAIDRYLRSELEVWDINTTAFIKIFSTKTELWDFLEKFVQFALDYEKL